MFFAVLLNDLDAHRGLGFLYIIYAVLQCDLPPLRPHCGEAPDRDLNPGQADLVAGLLTTRMINTEKTEIVDIHLAKPG